MARKPPKYRRHTARDLAFIEHNGKRTYLPGPYGSLESQTAYATFLKSIGFLVYESKIPEGTVSLALLCDRFNTWAKSYYPVGRKSRAANLGDALRLLLLFVSPLDMAVSFTPLKLKDFQHWLIGYVNEKTGKRLSRRYINDVTAAIKQVYKWGVSEELLPVESYHKLLTVPGLAVGRTAAKELPPKNPVEWIHVARTLPKLPPVARAMVEVHWLLGVRSDSLCNARPNQFDRSGKLWIWRPPKHKTSHLGHTLTIFIGPKAQKILRPFFAGKGPTDYVFQPKNKAGQRSRRYRSFYDSDSYRKAVRRAAIKASVPHWSPHRLRHALGTRVRDKHGLEAAQAALGHVRLDATQIYAQKRLALAKMVARTMG